MKKIFLLLKLVVFLIVEGFVKTDVCFSNPCLNGATCNVSNNLTLYVCSCLAGFSGVNCQISGILVDSFIIFKDL